jgi:prepilin-type N-terminal cleavage/methylation domain-containing protein
MITKKAFTLLELLVVLAIIVVLVALLLPALTAVRKRSLTVSCINNLHQLHLAWSMYREDYEDTYPASAVQIFPYVRNKQVFACPLDYFGGASPHATERLSAPVSYFYLLSDDINSAKNIEILRRHDPHHGVFYCVLHGTPCGGRLYAKNSFEGDVLLVRTDGAVRTKKVGLRCFRLSDGTYLIIRPPWDLISDLSCPEELPSMFCGVPDDEATEVDCPCGRPYR